MLFRSEPYSLLINHTTEAGKGIVLNLRSTTGHRDGIGASATVTLGDRQITAQLTAGDGYMCSSERKLFIGTGNSIQVENIQVRWPSGKIENFGTLASNAEYLLVEGSKAAFPLDNHDPDSIGADGSLKLNTRQTSNRPDSLHASQGIPGHE